MRSLLGSLLNRSPVPYSGYNGQRAYGAEGRGRVPQQATMEAMGASATLFAIVNRTSTATAKQPWHMHRKKAGASCDFDAGGPNECTATGVELVETHPALTVLNKPNPFFTRQELFESGQQHVDLTGEGWLVVGRIGRMPAELWLVRPDRMIVVTDPTDYLLGYIYRSPSGAEMPLKPDQVLSMRMPNPMDPYRGMGPVQTIMSQVDGAAYSAEWNANFYRNGARPGGIIKLSRRMNDPEFNRLVERFNINHRGTANANRTAFLEEGEWVDVKPMSVADMQLVETSNLNRDTILLAYGASKFDVGVLEDVNRAASGSAKADFGDRMIEPRLDRWAGMLNNDFLPMFPGDASQLCLVYSSPVPADRAQAREDKLASANVYKILIDARVAPKDAAEVAGLPEMESTPEPKPVMPALPPGRQTAPAVDPEADPAAEPAAA